MRIKISFTAFVIKVTCYVLCMDIFEATWRSLDGKLIIKELGMESLNRIIGLGLLSCLCAPELLSKLIVIRS